MVVVILVFCCIYWLSCSTFFLHDVFTMLSGKPMGAVSVFMSRTTSANLEDDDGLFFLRWWSQLWRLLLFYFWCLSTPYFLSIDIVITTIKLKWNDWKIRRKLLKNWRLLSQHSVFLKSQYLDILFVPWAWITDASDADWKRIPYKLLPPKYSLRWWTAKILSINEQLWQPYIFCRLYSPLLVHEGSTLR